MAISKTGHKIICSICGREMHPMRKPPTEAKGIKTNDTLSVIWYCCETCKDPVGVVVSGS